MKLKKYEEKGKVKLTRKIDMIYRRFYLNDKRTPELDDSQIMYIIQVLKVALCDLSYYHEKASRELGLPYLPISSISVDGLFEHIGDKEEPMIQINYRI